MRRALGYGHVGQGRETALRVEPIAIQPVMEETQMASVMETERPQPVWPSMQTTTLTDSPAAASQS